MGFWDLGIPELNAIRGYKTPNINKLAEVLSESGYNTVHIGKWHMGDIMESWPNHQGFDYASFPIHQQGQLTIFHAAAAADDDNEYLLYFMFAVQNWPARRDSGPISN